MREYLFELRKKVNKSQAEIDKILAEKYNLKIGYSAVELGVNWKTLSGERAKILADVLETTPDYIMQCDEKYGGYVGKHFREGHFNEHKVRGNRRIEYDAPLTKDEKLFAEQYIPYAEKIIDILRCNEYRWFLGNRMSYEDFYDIGMIAFLRAVKELSVKKIEQADFMNTLDNPDFFYRHKFSRAIKGAYYKYIRAELTLQRRDFHSAMALDSTISNKDGAESEQYAWVPSKDTPIPILAESSWNLDALYKYLNDRQIIACKLLIADWTVPEIVKGGYATKRDIGVIRFYLRQFKDFGKVFWETEDYKSDATNVHYNFITNKWVVKAMFELKSYSLGAYSDINVALDLHSILHTHLQKGDFLQWYEHHMRPNAYTSIAFTYPLPDEPEIEDIEISKELPKRRGGVEIVHATKDNYKGVSKNRNLYEAFLGRYKLGSYKTFEEALAIRQLAEVHYHSGDLDAWYAEFKMQKAKEKITYTRLDKHDKNGKISYAVIRTYQKKNTNLGRFSYEEAMQVKAMADNHIDAGDFEEWSQKFHADYMDRVNAERRSNLQKMRKTSKFASSYAAVYVICKYVSSKYILLCYDTCGSEHLVCETTDVEEAYKTMDLANEHIEAGDFNAWFADYKNI